MKSKSYTMRKKGGSWWSEGENACVRVCVRWIVRDFGVMRAKCWAVKRERRRGAI